MVRISKSRLRPSQLKKLYIRLSKTISLLDKSEANLFLDELLGEEEKIMIAKRFAAIVMLMEKNSNYKIAQMLHMSPNTVRLLDIKFNNGEYTSMEKMFKRNKKEYEDFWETLESVLRFGMPPIGKGRWKSTFEMLRKDKNNAID